MYNCTLIVCILPNISQSKGNQIMKFDHVIEYNKRNICLRKSCTKWGRVLVPDLFLFFKKALHDVKASGLQFSFNILFLIFLNVAYNKNNLLTILKQTLDNWPKYCDALCDLVPFAQFEKREKHPWRSVTCSKAAG